MQGIHDWIPTETKIDYINFLLSVGFDTLDCGSFVSSKVIPQMKDTATVISSLDLSQTDTKLLTVVANERGAEQACQFDEITYLGYPFSISETFQLRNTNSTIAQSVERVDAIKELTEKHGKELVIYISMAFGNPYGEEWNADLVGHWVEQMANRGISIISLADTIGSSTVESINYLFSHVIQSYPDIEIGAHIHTNVMEWKDKLEAAYRHGCRRFDGAVMGYGGCPMAFDDLVGNMPTEKILSFLESEGETTGIAMNRFAEAMGKASAVFPQ